MKRIKLKKSNLELSQMIMGCWAIGGGYTWGEQDEKTSIETLRTAFDMGITTFDTAEMYNSGSSEEIVGKALKSQRNKCLFMTKLSMENMSADNVENACKGSLDRMQTDRIDLLQIHWSHPDIPVEETIGRMDSLKSKGMVREIGVCNFGAADLKRAVKYEALVTNQLAYSVLFRAIEYGLLQECVRSEVDVLAYSPLSQGLLTGKFRTPGSISDERARIRFYSKERSGTAHQEPGYEKLLFCTLDKIALICEEAGISMADASLQWLLCNGNISALLVGARTPDQIRKNVNSISGKVSVDVLNALSEAGLELKEAMGSNADMWRTESRVK